MNKFIKYLFTKPFYKDWLFVLPVLIFISQLFEIFYDVIDKAPFTNLFYDQFISLLFTLSITVPFLIIRRYIKKKVDLPKAKAFISFQTNDKSTVQQIKLYLESFTDLDIWWQDNISAGENYKEKIEEVIKNSDFIFIMYSQNYQNSEIIQDWELPFLMNQDISRDDLTIIPCIVGEHSGEIPFATKYQVVPSRSLGFHRMIQKEIKILIKNLSKTISSQLQEKSSFKEYKDPKAFTFLYSLFLGFFIIGNFTYLFGPNQRDNLIDTAINYQLEIIEVEDRHTLFRQYDDPDNFYDQVIRDSLEHDINSIYINLVLDYSEKSVDVGYEGEWEELIIHAYNTRIFFINYMQSFDPWEERTEDDKIEQYNKHLDSYNLYFESLCSILDNYIYYEDYTFDLSSIWNQENYESFCKNSENQNNF